MCVLFFFSVVFLYGAAKAFFPPFLAFFFFLSENFSENFGWEFGLRQGGWGSAWWGSCNGFPIIEFRTLIAGVSRLCARWMNHARVPMSSHSSSDSGTRDKDNLCQVPND